MEITQFQENDQLNRLAIVPSFVNTREFEREARHFVTHGYYTNAPEGTLAYKEYWDEQRKRCIEGYTVGGVTITGEHYFYLNFTQIKLTMDEKKVKTTRLTFPRFLDMDYYYFHELKLARLHGQGMIVAKSRRKGFSYKNASLCAHIYSFERDSTCIIGAYLKEYSKLTMDMTLIMLNFINEHTAFRKRREPDRSDFVQARWLEYQNGNKVWKGSNSIVMRLTFKDNFSAAIGKKANLFLFEEAGKWPNLLNAWNVTEPTFRDGAYMIGLPIIFGTGGDMEGGTADFAEMFYDPVTYNLRPYDNIWDEGREGRACGLFIDDMWYKPGEIFLPKPIIDNPLLYTGESSLLEYKSAPKEKVMMVDEDGNSNRVAAEIWLDKERAVKRAKGNSQTSWEKYITQYPKTPAEAFLRIQGNIFPSALLNEHLGDLETNKDLRAYSEGVLEFEGPKVVFKPQPINPIQKFPHKSDMNIEGAIVIWEHPYRDNNGNIPFGLYVAGTDPYDQDTSTTASLGSTFIYKTFQSFDQTYNILVAEYTGRPNMAEEYYENTRKLLMYYSAQTLYENNLKGLQTYFKYKHCLYLLKEQPSIIDKSVKNSQVHRGYGIHMGSGKDSGIKRDLEQYARSWLLEKRGQKEDGSPIYNLHTIKSIPLVQELIAYNKDDGNFDRAISFILTIAHAKENQELLAKKDAEVYTNRFKSGIFGNNTPLFKKNMTRR
jgi:hypothetical protein